MYFWNKGKLQADTTTSPSRYGSERRFHTFFMT